MTNTSTKKAANSIVGKLTAGILAAAAVLSAAPAQAAGGPVLVVGDSLEVGAAPYLKQALAGTAVEVDAERSRSSSEGVRVLASELRPEHEVIVFPLGTNDLSAATLAASLASASELAGGRCMVIATLARPNLRGSSTAELNRVIARFAGQSGAQVMDWRSAATTTGVLGRDRIHATGQGYALRGSLLAEAVQGCPLSGDLNGIPAPRDSGVRVPERAPERPGRRPKPRPEPPARVPLPSALRSLAAGVSRPLVLVTAAAREAQAAASAPEPEPVLGAAE